MLANSSVKERTMGVDPRSFKETMAHWATGVSVVTALGVDGRPVGITANSVTSLSLEPPQVLISVNKKLYTHGAIIANRVFAISILREDQAEWGMRFAGLVPEVEDRFAGIDTFTAETGVPLLADALAWMDCEVRHVYDGEDHSIFVGEVMASGTGGGGAPLLYFDRKWRRLDDEPLPVKR